jgi:HKD family nuclease
MNWLQIGIVLLQNTLADYKIKGVAGNIIADVEAALTSLLAAHAKSLTFENVEALGVTVPLPDWANIKP